MAYLINIITNTSLRQDVRSRVRRNSYVFTLSVVVLKQARPRWVAAVVTDVSIVVNNEDICRPWLLLFRMEHLHGFTSKLNCKEPIYKSSYCIKIIALALIVFEQMIYKVRNRISDIGIEARWIKNNKGQLFD